MKGRKHAKEGWVALKLDMTKAYDRVEWGYVKAVMKTLSFSQKWLDLMGKCISSVKFWIRTEVGDLGPIIPERGLQQGNPLSPYLFLICAEGLSGLLNLSEANGRITGCRPAREAPAVSHLLFADDSYVYFKAGVNEATEVKRVLDVYGGASGQKLNLCKSSLVFSPSVKEEVRVGVCNVLGVGERGEGEMYLGLPTNVGRNRRETFNYIKERIWRKVNDWNAKNLSRGGKEVLIKAVGQSISLYVFNVFLLPKGMC